MLTYREGVEAFRVTDRLSDSDRAASWARLYSRSITGRRREPDRLLLVASHDWHSSGQGPHQKVSR